MKAKPLILLFIALFCIGSIIYFVSNIGLTGIFTPYKTGDKIDSLNGIYVYYNGDGSNTSRIYTEDGDFVPVYEYPSEEFILRYYMGYLHHKIPGNIGRPKDFFDKSIRDGGLNKSCGLIQFTNPGAIEPQVNDIIVLEANVHNRYGHIGIVSAVHDKKVQVIQQNVGKKTRTMYSLSRENGKFTINNSRILGWLRKSE